MTTSGKSVLLAIMGVITAMTTEANAADKPLPEWRDYMSVLTAAGEGIGTAYDASNPQVRQEAWNILFSEISRGYLNLVATDPDHPEFVPFFNYAYNVVAPNPDYLYYYTPLDGKGVYRLRGFKGTNLFTFLQVTGPTPDDPKLAAQAMYNSFRLDDVPGEPGGPFEFILSAEKPKGFTGHWEKLDPRATSMFMRSASYDWINERDPVVAIDRLDKPAGRNRPAAEETAKRLKTLVEFVRQDQMTWWKHVQNLLKSKTWNTISPEPWGTFPGQMYLEGLYRLADDEVLLIETEVPKVCQYWSFLIGDMHFRTGDYANNQVSINGFQAKLDSDGKFRAVISAQDPGVPNWLATGGNREGVIQGRWNNCDSSPVPTARVIKLSELRASLPADTPAVSPELRDQLLRDRRYGAQLRRKW